MPIPAISSSHSIILLFDHFTFPSFHHLIHCLIPRTMLDQPNPANSSLWPQWKTDKPSYRGHPFRDGLITIPPHYYVYMYCYITPLVYRYTATLLYCHIACRYTCSSREYMQCEGKPQVSASRDMGCKAFYCGPDSSCEALGKLPASRLEDKGRQES